MMHGSSYQGSVASSTSDFQQQQQQQVAAAPFGHNTAPAAGPFGDFPTNQAYAAPNGTQNVAQMHPQHTMQNTQPFMGGMMSPDVGANHTMNPNAFGHTTTNTNSRQDPPPPSQEEVAKMKYEALAAAEAATKAVQEQQYAFLRSEELQRAAEEAQSHADEIEQAMNNKKSKAFKRGSKKAQVKIVILISFF